MNADTQNFNSRTLLYYPTIDVPDNRWLRQAVLYWDNVASIVPKSYDDQIPANLRYSSNVRYLYSRGIFRPYNPEWVVRDPFALDAFMNEFKEKIDSDDFEKLRRWGATDALDTKIYRDKVNDSVFHILADKGLASMRPDDETYIYFQKQTAMLYMSLLAKHMTSVARDYTVTGTDVEDYRMLSFRAMQVAQGDPCYQIYLWNLLPAPTAQATFASILKFRSKYLDELKRFRLVIDEMRDNLVDCVDASDARDALAASENEIASGIGDITKAMHGSRLPYVLGALKALVMPHVAVSAAVAAGSTVGGQSPLAAVEINPSFGALAVGVLSVSYFLSDHFSTRRKTLQESDYAYLYLGQSQGILSP